MSSSVATKAMEIESSTAAQDEENKVLTENGSLALSTTQSAVLDLFFAGLVRGTAKARVEELVQKAWQQAPELTLRVLMHARDARGGKGERRVVLDALLWLRSHKPSTYRLNLRRFLALGYYKDLLQLAVSVREQGLQPLGANGEVLEVEVMGADLKDDMAKLEQVKLSRKRNRAATDDDDDDDQTGDQTDAKTAEKDDTSVESSAKKPKTVAYASSAADMDTSADGGEEKKDGKKKNKSKKAQLSLAGKWAPSANTSFDKKARLASRMAKLLFPGKHDAAKQYRVAMSELRSELDVVEVKMSRNDWSGIRFSAIPSRAHKLYRKALTKHEPDRYAKYLEEVKSGRQKINSTGLQPHELVSQYRGSEHAEDPTVEAQWSDLRDKLASSGGLKRALAVVDVSGSMEGTPMEVAIALGLLVSELTAEPFKNHLITFESKPQWHNVNGTSLRDRVLDTRSMSWGGSTNLLATFKLILEVAQANKIAADDMPSTLFVFSDMQFDEAVGGQGDDTQTTFQKAQSMYAAAGYPMPRIVFWNLRGDTRQTSFPVSMDEFGSALLSGYSSELLRLFMNEAEFTPLAILEAAVAGYEAEVDPEEAKQ